MENNSESPKPKPGKTIWKSPSRLNEKTTKSIRFNLEPVILNPIHGSSDSELEVENNECSIVGPPVKKRKNVIKVPEMDEMEEEIENQIDSKAEKSNLTVVNVKNILKSVITNKYVVDMVRQTVEEGGVTDVPFGPKLTRAKTKELLEQHSDLHLPSVVGYLTPAKNSSSDINPEIKLLIDKELAEDSSGEEYNPENEEEQSEEEEKGESSIVSDLDSMPPTPASIPAPPTPLQDWSQDGIFRIPPENVGQRTRSKLNLNRLDLESLEQAFVPPDVTHDMYEAECDNPDWHEFLKDFTQPLSLHETLEDDVDNDPEYNILEDIEGEQVEDKEEMRKDRAVKVSKRELNALMAELFDYTDNLTSDEEDNTQTTESIAALEKSILKETEDREKREVTYLLINEEHQKEEELKKREEERGIHLNQRHLLGQQLRQHIQLTTLHFLQTYKHPQYHCHAETYKTMLVTMSGLKNDNICCQQIDNIAAAMGTVAKWEELHRHPVVGERIRTFVTEQLKMEKTLRKKKKKANGIFPKELMRLVVESEAFLYPRLLPPLPFRTTLKMTGPQSFTPSENMLLAICLEQVTQLMNDNKDVYRKRQLTDLTRLISDACIPRSLPRSIAAHIRKLKCSKQNNPVKDFFETGKPPTILHFVIFVQQGLKLCQQPRQLLPQIWQDYLSNDYQKCLSSEPVDLPAIRTETLRQEIPAAPSQPKQPAGDLATHAPKVNGKLPLKRIKKESSRDKRSVLKVKFSMKSTGHTSRMSNDKRQMKKKAIHTIENKVCLSGESNVSTSSVKYSLKDNVIQKVGQDEKSHSSKDNISINCDSQFSFKSTKNKAVTNRKKRTNISKPRIDRGNLSYKYVGDILKNSKGTSKNVPNHVLNCAESSSDSPSQGNSGIINETITIESKTSCENGTDESSLPQLSEHNLSVQSEDFSAAVVNNVRTATRSISHCPKPPSTVKLKQTLNLTTKYYLNKGKTKVPTSFRYSQPSSSPKS